MLQKLMRPSFQVMHKYCQRAIYSERQMWRSRWTATNYNAIFIVSSNQHLQYEIVLKTAEINMQVHAVSSMPLVYSLCVNRAHKK